MLKKIISKQSLNVQLPFKIDVYLFLSRIFETYTIYCMYGHY